MLLGFLFIALNLRGLKNLVGFHSTLHTYPRYRGFVPTIPVKQILVWVVVKPSGFKNLKVCKQRQ
ncbi:hypothetical protein DMA11_19080 [Marinilabiliaceae bacterium JC017]|nr:hypothetical protein DMA11_19080 [Marinilabiliaceae bacterium JC017]